MEFRKKLLAILVHPDDESMGTGGVLAKYAAEGVGTYLVTATRCEKGWFGSPEEYPGRQVLGQQREAELHEAAQVLGLQDVSILDYIDGEFEQAHAEEVIDKLVHHVRRIRPQVVVTFDPYGYYGHPDHITISQHATAAVVAAADPSYLPAETQSAHRVSALYYLAATQENQEAYQAAFGDLVMTINGQERRAVPWADWAVTTRVDTSAYWHQVWTAISCHRSQLPGYQALLDLPQSTSKYLWGQQTFYRAFSLVNNGHQVEKDLFAGIRD